MYRNDQFAMIGVWSNLPHDTLISVITISQGQPGFPIFVLLAKFIRFMRNTQLLILAHIIL